MVKILTTDQMRQVEQECARIGLPSDVLMENAGRAVAEELKKILGDIARQSVLILVGPGNNGGDGLVAGRYLHDWGAKVNLYLFSQRPPEDRNFALVQERSIPWLDANQDSNLGQLDEWLSSATVVLDAVFGTGKSRPLAGIFASALNKVTEVKGKRRGLRIIAVDLPSGLDADSGAVDPACLYADNTITLGFPKPGLFNSPGAERAGQITVVGIGISPHLAKEGISELITDAWAELVLPKRPFAANKGSFGKVLVVAGSINYIGAAYLACSGAIRVGAGLVTLATATSLQPILAAKLTEVTYLPLPETNLGIIGPEAAKLVKRVFGEYNVMLVGCGLGQSRPTVRFIRSTLSRIKTRPLSLVVDADGLNTLARVRRWWRRLTGDAILTPHPGEMARLTGISIDAVQSDRLGTAKKAAQEWHKTIVLKGAYTVIASSDGRAMVSPFANPGLASAGTGDVLAGVIAGLVAQGVPLFEAAVGGVYLHGKAGEMVKAKLGDAGMVASDLAPALPLVIKQLKEKNMRV
jgi:NAD(P)H-hydrate epimerase